MFVTEDGIIEYDDDDCTTCDNWGCDDCVSPADAPMRAGEDCSCFLCQ